MNMKRIVLVMAILMVAVLSVGMVSAGLFDGLFGSSENNIVDIDDYQFNIPDGYELNNDSDNYNYKTYWFMSAGGDLGFEAEIEDGDLSKVPDGALVFNSTSMHYVNPEGKNITIRIEYPIGEYYYTDSDVSANKTIDDIEGQFDELDDCVGFSYLKDKSIISITAPDENTISNIIVDK